MSPPILRREEALTALADILNTPEFSRSDSLSRLLEYLVCRTLDGRVDELKEYSLGVEVFMRGQAFDPRIDNIVRVQARKLRQRLADYYAVPRTGVRIDLVKGSYVPLFSPMQSEQRPEELEKASIQHEATGGMAVLSGEAVARIAAPIAAGGEPESQSPTARQFAGSRNALPWYLLTALIAGLAGVALGFFYDGWKASSGSPYDVIPVQIPSGLLVAGTPAESRSSSLVIGTLKARLGETPGLRISRKPSRRDFRTSATFKQTGDRISMRLAALGGPGFRKRSERFSVMVEGGSAAQEVLSRVLIDQFLTDLGVLAADEEESIPIQALRGNGGANAAADFTPGRQSATNGAWSYGWELHLDGPFHPYQKPFRVQYWGADVIGWSMSGEGPQNGAKCCPFVAKNISGQDIKEPGVRVPNEQFWFHPGPKGERSVVRWTSKATGRYLIQTRFTGLSEASSDVHIVRNGVAIVDDTVDSQAAFHDVIIEDFMCLPEDTLDFVVGWGTDRDYNNDITGLDIRIAATPGSDWYSEQEVNRSRGAKIDSYH